MQVVEVPLGPSGVAGYAIDVEDQEQARADLTRFVRAQRDMLDRLSAGVAQFGRDRSLIFFNQPFARLFSLTADFLADRPEFDRVIDAMREAGNLPEVRDFPDWKEEHRRWFTSGPRGRGGGLAAARRQASARRRPAAPRRRPADHLRGPDRADPARLGARHLASGPHRDLRQSVRGGRRVRLGRPAQPVEQPLPANCGGSRRSSSPAIRGSTR